MHRHEAIAQHLQLVEPLDGFEPVTLSADLVVTGTLADVHRHGALVRDTEVPQRFQRIGSDHPHVRRGETEPYPSVSIRHT
jgi:hypothetical protein